MKRDVSENALFYWNKKYDIVVKMDKPISHSNSKTFVEECSYKSKILESGKPSGTGLKLSWNREDMRLRSKFYEKWFHSPTKYTFVKEDTNAQKSVLTIIEGSSEIFKASIDESVIDKIFSEYFKEDL